MVTSVRVEGRIARLEARSAARKTTGTVAAMDLRNVSDDELQAMWLQAVGDGGLPLIAGELSDLPDDDPAALHALVGRYMAALNGTEARAWQA